MSYSRRSFFERLLGGAALLALPIARLAPSSTPIVGTMMQTAKFAGTGKAVMMEQCTDIDTATISGELDAAGAQSLIGSGFKSYVRVFENGATSLKRDLWETANGW